MIKALFLVFFLISTLSDVCLVRLMIFPHDFSPQWCTQLIKDGINNCERCSSILLWSSWRRGELEQKWNKDRATFSQVCVKRVGDIQDEVCVLERPEDQFRFTCSSASRCRSGSGHRARRPGVRPSPSALRAGRTVSGWSAGKRTRSPTSALQTRSQSPAVRQDKQ